MRIYQKMLLFLSLIFLLSLAFSQPVMQSNMATIRFQKQVINFFHINSTKNLILLPVTGYQQTEDYTCGPATIMSLMHFYGMLTDSQMTKATELKIAKEIGTTSENGTSPEQMVKGLEKYGFDVTLGENGTVPMLIDNLKKGIPTIVEWIDWGGHWEIVMGYKFVGKNYDEDKDTIFFANSSAHFENANVNFINGVTQFNPDRFESMWFDAQYFKPGQLVKGIYIIATPKNNIH